MPKRNRRADTARQTGMRARFRGDKGIVKADPAGVVVVVEEGDRQGHKDTAFECLSLVMHLSKRRAAF